MITESQMERQKSFVNFRLGFFVYLPVIELPSLNIFLSTCPTSYIVKLLLVYEIR